MATFEVTAQNTITRAESGRKRKGNSNSRFSSESELIALSLNWPSRRLVEIWNRLPGATPLARFTSRRVATRRIWRELQKQGTFGTGVRPVNATLAVEPLTAPQTKPQRMLALLERSTRATLPEIIAYASHCTSPGRCEGFSLTKRLFDNLTPLPFCGGLSPGFS